jgi:hypothetical protein
MNYDIDKIKEIDEIGEERKEPTAREEKSLDRWSIVGVLAIICFCMYDKSIILLIFYRIVSICKLSVT